MRGSRVKMKLFIDSRADGVVGRWIL